MNSSQEVQQQRAAAWHRLAARTLRRINTGWWLSRLFPLLIALGIAGGAAVYLLRSNESLPAWPQLLAWAAGGVVLCGAGAWWLARARFLKDGDALVRLESRMGLHNALSTAQCGAGSWPEPPARAEDALARDLPRTWLPPLAAAALLAAGFLIPAAPDVFASAPPPPRSHEEIQAMLERQADWKKSRQALSSRDERRRLTRTLPTNEKYRWFRSRRGRSNCRSPPYG